MAEQLRSGDPDRREESEEFDLTDLGMQRMVAAGKVRDRGGPDVEHQAVIDHYTWLMRYSGDAVRGDELPDPADE